MRSIIFPYDGSDVAAKALPLATTLAARHKATLTIVYVVEKRTTTRGGQGAVVFDQELDRQRDSERVQTIQERIEQSTRDAVASAGVDVRFVVRNGAAAEEIAAEVDAQGADLVVLTTHGRGGFSRLWLGSVTEGLLRRLRVPVLVVPVHAEAVLPKSATGHVLVPLDETPGCEAMVDTARRVFGEDIRYTFVHVAAPLHPVLQAIGSESEVQRDLEEQRELAQQYVDNVVERYAPSCNCDARVETDVQPARAILRMLESNGFDTVALVTRNAGPIERFFLGSVADKVLRSSPVPVLLQAI